MCAYANSREIHIWAVRLRASETALAVCRSTLSKGEIERGSRFHFDHDRRAFVLRRGVLRLILAGYLSIEPQTLRLVYGPNGKPHLIDANSGMNSDIRFNISRTGSYFVCAVTNTCEVGIDAEKIDLSCAVEPIAQRFFCSQEVAGLLALPAGDRQRAFYRCWTRKEAYVKAIGNGLTTALDEFCVTLAPHEPATMVHIGGDPPAAAACTFHDVALGDDYACALAYLDRPRQIRISGATIDQLIEGSANMHKAI